MINIHLSRSSASKPWLLDLEVWNTTLYYRNSEPSSFWRKSFPKCKQLQLGIGLTYIWCANSWRRLLVSKKELQYLLPVPSTFEFWVWFSRLKVSPVRLGGCHVSVMSCSLGLGSFYMHPLGRSFPCWTTGIPSWPGWGKEYFDVFYGGPGGKPRNVHPYSLVKHER